MTYNDALDYVYSRRKFAKSGGFERISALLEKFSNPQKRLKFVHVVGTNGKGSVCTELSFITRQAGYKTGLFTSPFVIDFRERIQIDGRFIEKQSFAEIISKIKAACDELEKDGLAPTFFETVFAAALIYFDSEKCDIVVLEAGIGGRNDSTNIIPAALVTVITSVSFDHTEVLGDTLEKIAEAKCGVIKPGSTVIAYPCESGKLDFAAQNPEVVSVIEKSCEENRCRLLMPNMNNAVKKKESIYGSEFTFDGLELSIKFTGDHQIANAAVAVTAAKALADCGFSIDSEDIQNGLAASFIPARMEIIKKAPLILIDGGHNAGCMTALSKMISERLTNRKITAVLGFMKDKDYQSSIRIIAPLCENIVFTRADSIRAETPEKLAESANGLCKNIFCAENADAALKLALEMTESEDALICAGSFYLVSDIRKLLV